MGTQAQSSSGQSGDAGKGLSSGQDQKAPPTANAKDIERIDQHVIQLSDQIGAKASSIAAVLATRPNPPSAVYPQITALAAAPQPILERPAPNRATTLQSQARDALRAQTNSSIAEYDRSAARESPREERLRRDRELEEKTTGRTVVPVSDIAIETWRGIANRGTGNRIPNQVPPPRYSRSEEVQLADAFKKVEAHLERFPPFSEVDRLVVRLLSLGQSHFHTVIPPNMRADGGAPIELLPLTLQTALWSWPPRADVRRDLIPEFAAACRYATHPLASEAITLLTKRVAEIERYSPATWAPEGPGSIRA